MKTITLRITIPDTVQAARRVQEVLKFEFGCEVLVEPGRTNAGDVRLQYDKFPLPRAAQPSLLSPTHLKRRADFLREELDELVLAHEAGDLLEAGDALIDLAVVTHGTARMMALPWEPMWAEVMRANMEKQIGPTKRGYKMDLMKPPGWTGPNHAQFLGKGPWPVFSEGES